MSKDLNVWRTLCDRTWSGALRLVVACLMLSAMLSASAQQPDGRTIVAESEQIHTANGVEVREAVTIGGIQQWITVRGKDRRNPILLYIHGGPGDSMMGASWSFQRPWEDYFTVVQWEQRGSGKTNASNNWQTVSRRCRWIASRMMRRS